MIKRFDFARYTHESYMENDSDGEYCFYDDYEAMEKRAIAAEAKLAEIEKREEPIKWQSTTEVYTPYITQSRYEKLRPEFQKWYKPYVAVQQSPAVAVPEEETNFCALKSITDSQVNAVARAFWRRIYAYRNDYGIELPKPLPVEFMAHMATALTWVDKEPSTRITEQDAREIINSMVGYREHEQGIFETEFEYWIEEKGRTLIAKLNEHREPDYKAQSLIADAIEQMAKEFLEGWPDHKGKYDFMIGYAYRIRNSKASASTDNGEKNV